MDKMSVFSDAVNSSFNYSEINWQGNTFLVDFSSKDSILKLLRVVTEEDDLNESIKQLPDPILKCTPYRKFQESSGNQNWVLYKESQYRVMDWDGDDYLQYVGKSSSPEQPINLSSMNGLFSGCTDLKELDLDDWDTSHVVDMQETFRRCRKLKVIKCANWDTSNVTRMDYMFAYCDSLPSIPLDNWDTGKVVDLTGMFLECKSLTSMNLSAWDIGNVKNMSGMFFGCASLTSLDLSGWECKDDAIRDNLFRICDSLQITNNQEFDKLLKKRDDNNG